MKEYRFNVVKEERKALVRAISEIVGIEPRYMGAPSFAFKVGKFTISFNGTVSTEVSPDYIVGTYHTDNRGTVSFDYMQVGNALDELTALLAERGFVHEADQNMDCSYDHDVDYTHAHDCNDEADAGAVSNCTDPAIATRTKAGYDNEDEIAHDAKVVGDVEAVHDIEIAHEAKVLHDTEIANDAEITHDIDVGMSIEKEPIANINTGSVASNDESIHTLISIITDTSVGEDDERLSIDIPLSYLNDPAIANLEKLVAAKAWIIKKMVGNDSLPIVRLSEQLIRFPWFRSDASPTEVKAYTHLISRLCVTAKEKKRVMAEEKLPQPGDNEKYKARCFLLSLGFKGPEYSQARKILLAPFPGNGSFLQGSGNKESVSKSDLEAGNPSANGEVLIA